MIRNRFHLLLAVLLIYQAIPGAMSQTPIIYMPEHSTTVDPNSTTEDPFLPVPTTVDPNAPGDPWQAVSADSTTIDPNATTEFDPFRLNPDYEGYPIDYPQPANARWGNMEVLPNGVKFNSLTDQFESFDGYNNMSRVVANDKEVYVLYPVQTKNNTLVFDPYTIGQVLGYIYELSEFGPAGPPAGFTIVMMGQPVPSKQKKTRGAATANTRTGTLVFTKKLRREVRDKEDAYWKHVLKSL
ncbi:unnamed protein product [Caenorhabditis sp. 36 PRJEB53466]|nr:unnamed protein product [Caenorhabditis sp. 36 PRJEB53466]